MNELLKKIYEEVIYHEKNTQAIEHSLELHIHALLEPYVTDFSTEQMELIYGFLYSIQLKAMQEGFQHGTKYTVSTLFALLSDS